MAIDYSKFDDIMQSSSQFKGDEALSVRFFKRICEDESYRLDNGKPLSYLLDFIEIKIPNEVGLINTHLSPVNNSHKIRFARQWAMYQNTENKSEDSKQIVGYPLSDWAKLTKKQFDMLTNMGFDTVEQIASISENNALAITASLGVNGLVLKEHASKFLKQREVQDVISQEIKNQIKNVTEQSSDRFTSKGNKYIKPGTE